MCQILTGTSLKRIRAAFAQKIGLSCYMYAVRIAKNVRILYEPTDFLTEIGSFFSWARWIPYRPTQAIAGTSFCASLAIYVPFSMLYCLTLA